MSFVKPSSQKSHSFLEFEGTRCSDPLWLRCYVEPRCLKTYVGPVLVCVLGFCLPASTRTDTTWGPTSSCPSAPRVFSLQKPPLFPSAPLSNQEGNSPLFLHDFFAILQPLVWQKAKQPP